MLFLQVADCLGTINRPWRDGSIFGTSTLGSDDHDADLHCASIPRASTKFDAVIIDPLTISSTDTGATEVDPLMSNSTASDTCLLPNQRTSDIFYFPTADNNYMVTSDSKCIAATPGNAHLATQKSPLQPADDPLILLDSKHKPFDRIKLPAFLSNSANLKKKKNNWLKGDNNRKNTNGSKSCEYMC